MVELLVKTAELDDSRIDSGTTEQLWVTVDNILRVELPKFNGNALEWISVWEQFEGFVGEANIIDHKQVQLSVLFSCGEAKRMLQDLIFTAINYPIACTMWKKHFGKPEEVKGTGST